MSKAEEKAQAVYPAWRNGIGDEFSQNSAYYGFIEGYHQAEKDLELSWKDMKLIWNITDEMDNMPEEEFYQKVLNRFNKLKEK